MAPIILALATSLTAHAGNLNYSVVALLGSDAGTQPASKITLATDGRLYGTSQSGGVNNGIGVVWRMNPDGTGLSALKTFTNAAEFLPVSGVIEGSDKKLYGTTTHNGAISNGAIFAINTDGTGYSVLHTLLSTEITNIQSSLIQGADGAFYGVGASGGTMGVGGIFKINKDGTGYTILLNANATSVGANPIGALVQGSDGKLYGTMSDHATSDGVIFRMDSNGQNFEALHTFDQTIKEGDRPTGALTFGPDGRLFGTTNKGGVNNVGTVFAINANGTGFVKLHDFESALGAHPESGVTFGKDGLLYGTTLDGGQNTGGVLYQMDTTGGGFVVLHHMASATGVAPKFGGLTTNGNGVFYGTASTDSGGNGAVFKLAAAPSYSPPTITVKGKRKIVTQKSKITLKGTAAGNAGIVQIRYKAGKSGMKTAIGTVVWKANIKLRRGKNVVRFTATDGAHQSSVPVTVVIVRK